MPTPVTDVKGNVLLRRPDGRIAAVKAHAADRALAHGYTIAPEDEARAHIQAHEKSIQRRERYDTTGQAAFAALEGLESGLTFGLSPWLRSKMGIYDAEGAAARKEFNPWARGAGEFTGALLPAVFSGGATAAASGARGIAAARGIAKYAPAGVMARAGAGTTARVTSALAPAGSGTARQIVAKGLGTAAGAGLEGAAYGLGSQLEASAENEEPEKLGELAAATVMGAAGGAIFGGAMGGGGAALGAGLSKVGSHLSRPADQHWFSRWVEGRTGGGTLAEPKGYPARMAEAGVLANPASFAELASRRDSLIRDSGRRNELFEGVWLNLKEQLESVKLELREVSRKLRPAETGRLLRKAQVEGSLGEWNQAYNNTMEYFKAVQKEMAENAAYYTPKYRKAVNDLYADLQKAKDKATKDPLSTFNRLEKIVRRLDDHVEWNRDVLPVDGESIAALRRLRRQINAQLEDESIWGEAATRYREYNKALSNLLTARKTLEKEMGRDAVAAGESKKRIIDPTKIETVMNKPLGGLSRIRTNAIEEYYDAVDAYREQVRRSARSNPDIRLPNNSTEKARKIHEEAKEATELTQLWKQAHSQDILTSAPALSQGGKHLGEAAWTIGAGSSILGGWGAAGAALWSARKLYRDPNVMLAALQKYDAQVARLGEKATKRGQQIGEQSARFRAPASYGGAGLLGGLVEKDGSINQSKANALQAAAQSAPAQPPPPAQGSSPADDAFDQTVRRATAFLASKLPSTPPAGPMGSPSQPSAAAVAKYRRYVEVVDNPVSVMRHISAGTLTGEHLEALREVYPAIYADLEKKAMEWMANGTRPSAQQLQGLNTLFRSDLDGRRALGQALRARQQAKAQQQQAPSPTPARADRLDISNRVGGPGQ